MCHALHTLLDYDVSSLPRCGLEGKERNWSSSVRLKVFTQKAAVSREAGGLQRSRPTGSSSQTKSEEETANGKLHMTSYINSKTRLGGSVESKIAGSLREGCDLYFMRLRIKSAPRCFRVKSKQNSKQSFLKVAFTDRRYESRGDGGAERRKSLRFSRSADGRETHVG